LNGLYDPLESATDVGIINYSISDSELIEDGIYDPYELDADGDGCNDSREESINDPDDDGMVGSTIPTVTDDGLVSSHLYGPAANNFWQNATLIKCIDISGVVFEDINYGGGIGRDYISADLSAQLSSWSPDDIALENVIVELYSSDGTYVGNTTTDASGRYNFVDAGTGTHFVRMVNSSALSNRASNGTAQSTIPVQTFRNNGTSSFSNEVGGNDPSKQDAPPNTTDADLSALTSAIMTTQSVSNVSVETVDLTGVDFGLNYDVIVNTNDGGQGSLRQFIINSNELENSNLDQEDNPTSGVNFNKPLGTETSIFKIPTPSVQNIVNTTTYPNITDEFTHISGYTQEGSTQGDIASRVINVEISSSTNLIDALVIDADNTTISGLSVYNYRSGIIGNTAHSDGFIWGNYIGVRADGITPQGNSTNGISLQNFTNSHLGTNGDGANDANEGNIISDNSQGIVIRNASDIWVSGNIIGLDKNGNAPIGNSFNGVFIRDAVGPNIVGFNGALATADHALYRNIISANGNDGIRLLNSDNQLLSGNYLGTDITGMQARGNRNFGIQLQGSSSNNKIGVDGDGSEDLYERNVISANGSGIRMQSGGTGNNNVIAGNFIGTDISGSGVLGNSVNGIDITGSFNNNIIGTNADNLSDALERNVISSNGGDGIRLFNTTNNLIAGNFIGVGSDGLIPLGNNLRGIFIVGASSSNIVGYHPTMINTDELVVGNFIKNNTQKGIALSDTGTENRISRNQISNNGDLGIDLG